MSRRHLPGADKVAVIFTRDLGLVRGRASSAGRLHGRLKAAIEPFVESDFHFWEPASSSAAVKIIGAKRLACLVSHDAGLDRLTDAAAICQLMESLTPARHPNALKYDLLKEALAAQAKANSSLVRMAFDMRLMGLAGWGMEFYECVKCGRSYGSSPSLYFSVESGGAVCRDHVSAADADPFGTGESEIFRMLERESFERLAQAAPAAGTYEFAGASLERVGRWLGRHVERHLARPLSADVFREKLLA